MDRKFLRESRVQTIVQPLNITRLIVKKGGLKALINDPIDQIDPFGKKKLCFALLF